MARRLGVGLYSAPGALAPVRVVLSRSFFAYRPHPPHSQAHRDFAALRLIRDAFAVRERRGDPRVVPSFRCPFLPGMPPPMSPERSEPCSSSSSSSDIGLRQDLSSSALSLILPSVSSRARISGLTGSPSLRPVKLLAPLDGSDQDFSQPQRAFTSRLPASRSPFSLLDITTTVTGRVLSVGFTPTGMAAILAAPDPYVRPRHTFRRFSWAFPMMTNPRSTPIA